MLSFEDAHETVPPSQVAVRVTVPFLLTAAYPLSIVIVAVVAAVTVTVQVALLPPAVAVRTAVPTPFAVTTPCETVATLPSEVSHVTVLSVAFEGVTVTTSVPVAPTGRERVLLSIDTPVTSTAEELTVYVVYSVPLMFVVPVV